MPAFCISLTYTGSVVAVIIGITTSGFVPASFMTDCGIGCVHTMLPWHGITS